MQEITMVVIEEMEKEKERLLKEYFNEKPINVLSGKWLSNAIDKRQDFWYEDKWVFSVWVTDNLEIQHSWNN